MTTKPACGAPWLALYCYRIKGHWGWHEAYNSLVGARVRWKYVVKRRRHA